MLIGQSLGDWTRARAAAAGLNMIKYPHVTNQQPLLENSKAAFLRASSNPAPGGIAPRHSEKIAIKSNGRIRFIHPNDVVIVQAEGSYVSLQYEGGSYRLRESISEVAQKLEPYGFIRVHRSMLINSAWVQEILLYLKGDSGLRLRTGKEVAVAPAYRENLRLLAELWF
jgi:DNA-binding LytR/AlgR family response regulator